MDLKCVLTPAIDCILTYDCWAMTLFVNSAFVILRKRSSIITQFKQFETLSVYIENGLRNLFGILFVTNNTI